MKKLLIPFVASFGLSLGIATGVVVVRSPKAAPVRAVAKTPAVQLKPDSVPVVKDTTADPRAVPTTDSAAAIASGQPAPAVTVEKPIVPQPAPKQNQSIASAPTAENAKFAANPIATTKPASPPAKPASDSLIGRRLAQVFGAMQAKDAARVLEQMDDTDVRAILGSLSSKQQAAILGSFPTQRAALILQATLRTASSGGAE